MSHDVKYIGMDVHKEAIVIAVQNGTGKLVMETIVETKASSILQFLHGAPFFSASPDLRCPGWPPPGSPHRSSPNSSLWIGRFPASMLPFRSPAQ